MTRTEGQVYGGGSLVARYASFVKLPHTLFALPFAGVGALFASYAHAGGLTWASALWIVIAFTAARFAAMGFNRIVDRRHDALNPRTARRELPSGRLSVMQATLAVVVASALFVFAAWMLNPLCGMLSPIALFWIFFYSYAKRFTAWAHHILGLALGIAPVGAYLAVAGEWAQPWYALPLLAAAVMFWVAGFDVIYAVQDLDFDRAQGLHSIPARTGARTAFALARLFHAIAAALFLTLGAFGLFPVGRAYLIGVAVVVVLLFYEHAAVRRAERGTLDLATIDRAFFRTNVAVSMTLFAFTLIDRLGVLATGGPLL
ncbi:MAG: UbiA-like polyprenyltransferase [Longimicrobiales bacterium]